MNRRDFIAGAISVAAGRPGRAGGNETLHVAGTVSQSGQFRAFGAPTAKGLALWRERVNAAGGLGGTPVSLVLADDASDPEVARTRFMALAKEADVLVAPYGSWLTRAVLPVVTASGRPCIAPTAGDRAIWAEPRRWTVQLLNPVDTMLHSAVEVARAAGARRAAFLLRDDPFSKAVMRGAYGHATELGLEVAVLAAYKTPGEARNAAGRIRDADPEVDFLAGMGFRPDAPGAGFVEEARLILEALREAKVRPRLLCLGIGAAVPAFVEAVGVAGSDGVLGSTGWQPYLPTPGNDAFLAAYRSRFGAAPNIHDIHAAQGFAVGEVIAAAWRRAGAGSGRPGPAALRDALFALDAETVFGRYRVDPNGLQVGKTNAVTQWQDGRPVVLWPERYATGTLRDKPIGSGGQP